MVDTTLKQKLFNICFHNQLHHLGSYFSSLDIIDQIYSIKNPEDIFILSNGHAAVALYVVLEKYYGFNAQDLLDKYGEHPKLDEKHKIYCSTGSLGLGILVAVGRAVANKNRNVYCLISDGESAEGSVWEALKFAYEKDVTNLKIYVNANGYCAYDTIDIEYLKKRLMCFHPELNFINTTVEHYDFLKGIEAHYITISPENYERYK